MLRDGQDQPTLDGKFKVRRFILESAVEGQEAAAFAPDTDQLDDKYENYARHFTEMRNGKQLKFLEIGVRERQHRDVITPTDDGDSEKGEGKGEDVSADDESAPAKRGKAKVTALR